MQLLEVLRSGPRVIGVPVVLTQCLCERSKNNCILILNFVVEAKVFFVIIL